VLFHHKIFHHKIFHHKSAQRTQRRRVSTSLIFLEHKALRTLRCKQRFVNFVHFCGGKAVYATLCELCALLWYKSRVSNALCSKKSEASNLRLCELCALLWWKSRVSNALCSKKSEASNLRLCELCALLW
jgi:hypothetical protein